MITMFYLKQQNNIKYEFDLSIQLKQWIKQTGKKIRNCFKKEVNEKSVLETKEITTFSFQFKSSG